MLAMLVQAWVCAHACACTGPVPLAGARESVAGRVAAARLVHPLRQDVQRGFVPRVPGPNRPSAWSSSPRPCPPGSSLECLRCLVQVECDLKVDRDIRQKRRRTETRRSFRENTSGPEAGAWRVSEWRPAEGGAGVARGGDAGWCPGPDAVATARVGSDPGFLALSPLSVASGSCLGRRTAWCTSGTSRRRRWCRSCRDTPVSLGGRGPLGRGGRWAETGGRRFGVSRWVPPLVPQPPSACGERLGSGFVWAPSWPRPVLASVFLATRRLPRLAVRVAVHGSRMQTGAGRGGSCEASGLWLPGGRGPGRTGSSVPG